MVSLAQLQYKYPGVKWDLRGVEKRIVELILPVFEKIVTAYPVILERLEYIGTGRGMHGTEIAVTHNQNPDTTTTDYTCICLNPEYYGDYTRFTRQLDSAVAAGFHPANTNRIDASFAHELGHVLMFALLAQTEVALTPVVARDGFGLVSRTVEVWLKSHVADENLSGYATENYREAWAEGFMALEYKSPPVPYTVAQSKLLSYIRGMEWCTDWRYARDGEKPDQLVQLVQVLQG